MAEGSRVFSTWLEGFVQDATRNADAFVGLVDDTIVKQIPELAQDPVLLEDMHQSTRAQFLAFLAVLDQPEHRLMLPSQAVDLARSLARRGKDLGVLLKIYRDGHKGVLAYFSEVADALDAAGPAPDEVLKYLWTRADLWMADSIEALIETFAEERQQQHEGALARRTEMIGTLLDGAAVAVDDATKTLGHPLRKWQSAFVIWAAAATTTTTDALLATADDVAKALGGSRPLTFVAGSRDLWAWVATTTQPEHKTLATLSEVLASRGVHLASGIPAPGARGFRSSHAEARAAQHLTMSAPHIPPLVSYGEVELLCLAAESGDLLRRMVDREVGALCGADKNLALVRETALTYLMHRLNVEATAEKLFVHKNTVRYRLARAEELLGHPLNERSAHVELALRYVSLFGPPASVSDP